MIAAQTYDPDLECRSADERSEDVIQHVMSRRLGLPGRDPEDDVYRWEDDGGAVLAPAEWAA